MKVFAEEKGKRFLEAAKHLTPDHAEGDRVDEDVKAFVDWFTSGVAEKSKALKKMAKVIPSITLFSQTPRMQNN